MNKGKKFVSFFLIFALLVFSGYLVAKENQGNKKASEKNEKKSYQSKKPPLSPARIAGEVLLGGALGVGLGADDGSNQKLRRWAVSAYLGTTSSGPAKDLENAMKATGFDQIFEWYWGTQGPFYSDPYPDSHTGIRMYRLPWMLKIHYSLKPLFGVGLVFSNTEIGETHGFNEATGRLNIKYSVNTFSPIVSVQALGIQFGVGPALYIANSFGEVISGGMDPEEKNYRKIGFLIDSGFAFPPKKTRFFLEIKIQYRAVGQVKVGPYEIRTNEDFKIFPTTEVNYNHWFIGAGMGIRF